MQIQRSVTVNEPFNVISVSKFINKIINQSMKLASNGGNKIRLDIQSKEIYKKYKIKRQAVDLLVTNILCLNIKNISNGIIGIKLMKDDFDQDHQNEQFISVGSKRDKNSQYFIIEIKNSKMKLKIEDQTLMDIFTFNTFLHLCRNSNSILTYKNTFENCKLYIP